MTLVTNRTLYPNFANRLDQHGIPHMTESEAAQQDVYPLDFGLANMMPASSMPTTEIQWVGYFASHPVLQTRPHFIKFDDDLRERAGASRQGILKKYTPLSQIDRSRLNLLVVTGDNLETTDQTFSSGKLALEPEDISYRKQLEDLVRYAEDVPVTIFSCLAAHFALHVRHGLRSTIVDPHKKVLGVFEHDVVDPTAPLMNRMGDVVVAPHSRWKGIPMSEIAKIDALQPMAVSRNPRVGWLALLETLANGNKIVYLQGHPEYDHLDLHNEYRRDQEKDSQADTAYATKPSGYYPDDDCSNTPQCNWPPYTSVLYGNILGMSYAISERRRREQQSAEA